MIGRKVTTKKREAIWDSEKKAVINWRENIIIEPEELYTPDKDTTLNWRILAQLEGKGGTNGDVLFPGYHNDFHFMLGELIDSIKEKKFVHYKEPGCWIFDNNHSRGIMVCKGYGSDDHGRTGSIMECRYPLLKADAREYATNFFSGLTYIAQVKEKVVSKR
jgi:hypothetical protein